MTGAEIEYKIAGFKVKSASPIRDHQEALRARKRKDRQAINDIISELGDINISIETIDLD